MQRHHRWSAHLVTYFTKRTRASTLAPRVQCYVTKGRGRVMTCRHSILAVTLVFLAALFGVTLVADTPYQQLDFVDAKGAIRKPPDFRDRYQLLGTYMVLDQN